MRVFLFACTTAAEIGGVTVWECLAGVAVGAFCALCGMLGVRRRD
jgi:hypothetical protein